MKTKKLIFGILTLVWVAIIFSFSLQSGEVSSDISSGFGRRLLELFVPRVFEQLQNMPQAQLDAWHLVLRKCAHFTEFMVLGILSTSTLLQTTLARRGIIAMCFCVAIASIDETIQLFVSGRAGKLQDVLLDSVGAFVGIVVACLVMKFVTMRNSEKKVEICRKV